MMSKGFIVSAEMNKNFYNDPHDSELTVFYIIDCENGGAGDDDLIIRIEYGNQAIEFDKAQARTFIEAFQEILSRY